MAAAEARTAWQRAANRYFVQEDAKRAPKLACCQSSNPSSKQIDPGNATFVDGVGHPTVGFRPSDRSPLYSSLSRDSKWWLQMQPNYGCQRVLNLDQFNIGKSDVETSSPVTMNMDSRVESINSVEFEEFEKHSELSLEEMDVVDVKVDQDSVDLRNMTDYYEFLEMEKVWGLGSKRSNEFSSNADSSWMGGEKVPWWRVTDGDELASFVAHKSLHHVENCDLPPPQKVHVRSGVYKRAMSIDHDEMHVSSGGWETQSDGIPALSSGGSQRKHCLPVKERLSQNDNANTERLRTNITTLNERRQPVSDPSKAQLLEALCHSQTRAREAEKAAKEAYTEKEHLLKLFFRQASQLFAYKQWFKMLQLETLLLQQNKDGDPSFPDLLPWMPLKHQKLRKSFQKSGKSKQRKRGSRGDGNDMSKYAVAFALGFTLVGAGLILGWTVGWLLPTF